MKAKEIRRKVYAIALVACMTSMTMAPAQAAGKSPSAPVTQPTRFTAPEILKDASGHTYDLGGMEIIVRDWWTETGDPNAEKSEYDLARDEYLDWIQETYNFTIKCQAISNWTSAPQDFYDYASAPADDKNYVFMLRDDQVMAKAFKTGLCADLSKLSCLDFSEQKFQSNLTHEAYTFGDAVYAMYAGYSEPRAGVYFNKKLLQEAGVDPESIYDMQANGTWTWDAFEQLCKKVARDTDNDGVIDVYACNANNSLMVEQAVLSNGGNFISKDENGKFLNVLRDEKSIEGLRFAQKLLDEYWQVEPEGVEWDYYRNAYLNGEYVFLIDQAYVMNGELMPKYDEDTNELVSPGMSDPVGFVMFPKGPQATDYVNCWSNNFSCIPSNYDADRTWKIAFAWNLYTDEVPGYENNEEWKVMYKNFDDRAINETLNMMREKGTVTCVSEIPEMALGRDLSWNVSPHDDNLDELIETTIKNWDYLVKRENGEVQFPEVKKDASGKPYDLGGMEIIVADWWSEPERPAETVAEIARQDYLDWIQATYNFKISRQRICEWSDANEMALNYVNAGGDDKNYLFSVHTDYTILDEMKAGKFYDLSTLDCLDFSKKKFQESNTHLRWSYEDEIYGMYADRIDSRGGVLFNKQLLIDAGISPDEIYDMQADGTWTWDKFEELCKKATRDRNNDGVIDVYGCEGNPRSVADFAIYSNGGVYAGKDENDRFSYDVEDEGTLEALEFTKKLVESDFWRPDPAGAEWDDYYDAFCNREIAFMPGEYMSVYSPYWNYFGTGELGFVMFPKGPRGENYADGVISTAVVIPSCYDEDRAWKIAFAWDLFTDETYDYDDSEEWKKGFEDLADERTLRETLSIPVEGVVSCQDLFPGMEIAYNVTTEIKKGGPSIAELIDKNHVEMENIVRLANGDEALMQDQDYGITNKSLTLYDNIAIEFKLPAAVSYDNYTDQYLLVKMNGKESVIYPTRKDDLLVFTLNVGPHMLGDEILVEPHAMDAQGKEVVGQRLRYSVKTYCMNILTKPAFAGSDYADLRKLCVDMLAYGDAAQIYAGYKKNALASADLTDAQRQQGTNPSAAMSFKTVKNKYYGTISDSAMLAEISSVALYLEGTVNIQFKITAANLDGLRVVVTDGANELGEYVPDPNNKDGNGRYCVNFDGLNAGQMKKTVYATVMKGNKKVSNTYRYSIESYVNSMLGKGGRDLDNLLRAMMRYGNSAAEYAQNHQQ
ncbi:MAG: extracellular solute-binding protein [Lachnospiraceae bacterium]|nr:extracellular solute-binding protein [Lachnospiraceae bacterium]